MKIKDHVSPIDKKAKELFIKMLRDPECWSEAMMKQTLEKAGGSKPFTVEDVKLIVKTYLGVLTKEIELIKK